jgi:signal peptidase I
MSSTVLNRVSWPTVVASLPLVLWGRDNFYSLVRVQGASMEPTLQQGDVVLVRKADKGALPRLFSSLIFGDTSDGAATSTVNRGVAPSDPSFARLYERPPQIKAGQVVVFQSVETAFPPEWIVKRVWGTHGCWVQVEQGYDKGGSPLSKAGTSRRYRRLEGVPKHSVYVGGDNRDCSRDSRHYGVVSQNLVVGVATRVVWPPWRMGRLPVNTEAPEIVAMQQANDDIGTHKEERARV